MLPIKLEEKFKTKIDALQTTIRFYDQQIDNLIFDIDSNLSMTRDKAITLGEVRFRLFEILNDQRFEKR